MNYYTNHKVLKKLQGLKVGDKVKLPRISRDGSKLSTCTILGICYDRGETIYTIKHWNKYHQGYVYKALDEFDMYLRLESLHNYRTP